MRLPVPLLVLSSLAGCGPPVAPAPPELPPEVVLRKVKVRSFRGSRLELEVGAPSLSFERTGPRAGQVTGGPVELKLPVRGVSVVARTVAGDAFQGELTATDAWARTASGAELRAPAAHFSRREGAEGTVSTDAGVRVSHPRLQLTARAGRLDLASGDAEAEGVETRLTRGAQSE